MQETGVPEADARSLVDVAEVRLGADFVPEVVARVKEEIAPEARPLIDALMESAAEEAKESKRGRALHNLWVGMADALGGSEPKVARKLRDVPVTPGSQVHLFECLHFAARSHSAQGRRRLMRIVADVVGKNTTPAAAMWLYARHGHMTLVMMAAHDYAKENAVIMGVAAVIFLGAIASRSGLVLSAVVATFAAALAFIGRRLASRESSPGRTRQARRSKS